MKTTTHFQSQRRGFTLIELLTVIAIIGILAAIIIPVVGRVRQSAKIAQGISNMRQICLGVLTLSNDNRKQTVQLRAMTEADQQGPTDWVSPVSTSYQKRSHSSLFSDPLVRVTMNDGYSTTMFSMNPIFVHYNSTTNTNSVSLRTIRNPSQTVLLVDGSLYVPNAAGVTNGARTDVRFILDSVDKGAWKQAANISNPDVAIQPGPDINADSTVFGEGYISWRVPGNKAKVAYVDGHVKVVAQGEILRRHVNIYMQ